MMNNRIAEMERALMPIYAATKLGQLQWVRHEEDGSISLYLSNLDAMHITSKGQVKITDEIGTVLFNAEDIESERAKKIYELVCGNSSVSALLDFVKAMADDICGKETNA